MMRTCKMFAVLLAVCLLGAMLLTGCATRVSKPFDVAPEELLPKESGEEAFSDRFLTLDSTLEDWFTVPALTRLYAHFDRVYPILCNTFNGGRFVRLYYRLDTTREDVPAFVEDGDGYRVIAINPQYFKKNCEDFSLLSRELARAVFTPVDARYDAPATANGGAWISDAIAEYGLCLCERESYEFAPFQEKQRYTDSGRVAFRFFVWISENYESSFFDQLIEALRCEAYNAKLFVAITGYTVDDLWEIYAASDHGVIIKN